MTNSEQILANNERIDAVAKILEGKAGGSGLTAEKLLDLLEDTETIIPMLNAGATFKVYYFA